MERWTEEFHKAFYKEQDRVIREAIISHGFNPGDHQFLKDHCQLITYPFDDFQHLYYHYGEKDEKRIISIEAQPNIDMGFNGWPDAAPEIHKCSISAKYY